MQREENFLVTIVTVSFNSSKTIETTLESVLNQSYRSIQYIIKDGGSTDGTVAILEKYVPKFKKVGIDFAYESSPDQGIYDAMNKGMELAGGEILHFLNADDSFVDNQVVSDAVHLFTTEPDTDLVFGDAVFRTPSGDFLRRYRRVNARTLLYDELCHQVVFAHRRLFETFDYFNLGYRLAADYDWLLRVFRGGATARYLPRAFANFRLGGASDVSRSAVFTEKMRIRLGYSGAMSYRVSYLLYRAIRKSRQILGHSDFVPITARTS